MRVRSIGIALTVFLTVHVASGQRVSFGFIGGTNLTRDFPISRVLYVDSSSPEGLTTFDLFSDTRSFLSGISFEVDIWNGVSLEANALRRKLHLRRRLIFPNGVTQAEGRFSITTWQFPILLKYRLPSLRRMGPFVEAGPSFRTRDNPVPSEPSQVGGTVGAGAEFRAGRFRISPAIRYTRWRYDGDYPRIATKRDQIELVTTIGYSTSVPSWKVAGKKLRFGLIGGAPLTNGLNQSLSPDRIDELQGYLGGFAAEVELTRRWSIEVNGLYRPFQADRVNSSDPTREFRSEFAVLTWQFPVLAKYGFPSHARIQPVVEAGPSFRLSGNLNGYSPSSYGFTTGGGIDVHYKALKIGPVLRYTRWANDNDRPRSGTTSNQVELLVGLTF